MGNLVITGVRGADISGYFIIQDLAIRDLDRERDEVISDHFFRIDTFCDWLRGGLHQVFVPGDGFPLPIMLADGELHQVDKLQVGEHQEPLTEFVERNRHRFFFVRRISPS